MFLNAVDSSYKYLCQLLAMPAAVDRYICTVPAKFRAMASTVISGYAGSCEKEFSRICLRCSAVRGGYAS